MIALLGALLGCGDGPGRPEAPEATLEQAAGTVTLGTIRDLGPCVVRSSVRREVAGKGPARVSEETSELRWQDQDHWSWVSARDGRTVAETIVWDGVAWSAHAGRPLERKGDAEPFRVQLGQVWDPWTALEGLAEQVALVPGDVEDLAGRRTVRHAVQPRALPEKAHRTWVVDAAEGAVWIDEATAVRVQGDVRVSAASRTERKRVDLAFTVDAIGGDPAVRRPPDAAAPATRQDGLEPAPSP